MVDRIKVLRDGKTISIDPDEFRGGDVANFGRDYGLLTCVGGIDRTDGSQMFASVKEDGVTVRTLSFGVEGLTGDTFGNPTYLPGKADKEDTLIKGETGYRSVSRILGVPQ